MLTNLSISAYGFYSHRGTRTSPIAAEIAHDRDSPRKPHDDFYIRSHTLAPAPVRETTVKIPMERVNVDKILLKGVPSYSTLTKITDDAPLMVTEFYNDITIGLSWLFSSERAAFSNCGYRFYGCEVNPNWPPVVGVQFDYIEINARGVSFVRMNPATGGVPAAVTHFEYLGVFKFHQPNKNRLAMSKMHTHTHNNSRAIVALQPVYQYWSRVYDMIKTLRSWQPLQLHLTCPDGVTRSSKINGYVNGAPTQWRFGGRALIMPDLIAIKNMVLRIEKISTVDPAIATMLARMATIAAGVDLAPPAVKAEHDAVVTRLAASEAKLAASEAKLAATESKLAAINAATIDNAHQDIIDRYQKFCLYRDDSCVRYINPVYLDAQCTKRSRTKTTFDSLMDAFHRHGFEIRYIGQISLMAGPNSPPRAKLWYGLGGVIVPGKSTPAAWTNASVDRFVEFAREYLE